MLRKFLDFLGRLAPGDDGAFHADEPFPSVVLLLQSPRKLTRQAVQDLACRAWGTEEDTPGIVGSTRAGSWIIAVSGFYFSVHTTAARYEVPGREANQVRRIPWDEHTAWMAVDYPRGTGVPRDQWSSIYKLLLLMANQLWDDNCLGLYFPAECATIPNHGDLIGSIRWAIRNGVPLPFLKDG